MKEGIRMPTININNGSEQIETKRVIDVRIEELTEEIAQMKALIETLNTKVGQMQIRINTLEESLKRVNYGFSII